MDTPGNLLRSERENQKKSLEEIEKTLKITIVYLRAIENDDYGMLPADVFTKSYLRLYAGALGLESGHILKLYKEQFGTPPAKEPEPPKKQLREILPTFSFNYTYLLAICIGLVIVSAAVFTKDDAKEPVSVTVANPPADVVTKSKAVPPPAPEKAVQEEAVPEEDLSLKIAASELTWVSIKIDSAGAEELLLRAGESTSVTAHEKFVLKIGNAGSTSLILNGTDIGNLGPQGQVVDITLP